MWSRIAGLGIFLCLLVPASIRAEPGEESISLQEVNRIGFDEAVAGFQGQRVVDLYVRVVGRFGSPIRNLGPQDFEIWQDDELIDSEDLVVSTLETTGRGVTAVLAIDASGTMRGEPFAKAKEAAGVFLDKLHPEDRVAILAFSEGITTVSEFGDQRSVARQELRDFEIDVEHSRHTLLYDGVFRSLDQIRTSSNLPHRSFVILFSDGKDDGSDRTKEDVLHEAKGSSHQSGILIFSVGYARFGGAGLDTMRVFAEETGGEFMEAKSLEDMLDFFDLVARQMTQSYVVTYPASMDGEQHEIRVTIAGKSGEFTAFFPDIPLPKWPWAVGLLGVAMVAGVIVFLRSRGTVGRLSIVSGSNSGTQIALKKGKTLIGALEDNDVVLADSRVSRYHAEIVVRGRSIELADLDSTNGTMINGQPVKRGPIGIGDKITFADVEIIFEK